MRAIHFDDQIPDFGSGGCTPACRVSGYVMGDAKNNPLQFSGTTDSAKVTCKACFKVLARRTANRLDADHYVKTWLSESLLLRKAGLKAAKKLPGTRRRRG